MKKICKKCDQSFENRSSDYCSSLCARNHLKEMSHTIQKLDVD